MKITITSLIKDSLIFFINHINYIFLVSLISGNVSIAIYYFLIPINETFTTLKEKILLHTSATLLFLINQLSDEEKQLFVKISFLSLIAILIGLALLISLILTHLSKHSLNNNINIIEIYSNAFHFLPNVFILVTICIVLICLSFMLFFFLGIIFSVFFSLSPIILINKKNSNPFYSIMKSTKVSFNYFWIIIQILFFWIIIQIIFFIFFKTMYLFSELIQNAISITLNNLITSFILICFFRLHMLVK